MEGRKKERAKALQALFFSVGHNGHQKREPVFFCVFLPTEISTFMCYKPQIVVSSFVVPIGLIGADGEGGSITPPAG